MWPYSAWTSAIASSAATRSSALSPMPTRIPRRERDPQLAGGADRLQAHRRVLGRRALVDDEVRVDRLEHQPLRGGDLAQPRQVLAREHAEIGVRQHPALERALAGPDDVGDEVCVAVRGEPLGDHRVDLRHLAGEDEQLLGVSPDRLLEALVDLVRRVEVRLVGGEGAVLAVAATRPRERERVVAGERDALHGPKASGAVKRSTAYVTCCARGLPRP